MVTPQIIAYAAGGASMYMCIYVYTYVFQLDKQYVRVFGTAITHTDAPMHACNAHIHLHRLKFRILITYHNMCTYFILLYRYVM